MKSQTDEMPQTAPREPAPVSGPEEFLRLLLDWKGPPDQFWGFLLAAQCRLAEAAAAAVFRAGAEGIGVMSVFPGQDPPAEARDWSRFAAVATETLEAGRPLAKALAAQDDLYGQAPRRYLVAIPLPSPDPAARLAGMYLMPAGPVAATERAVERLEWTAGLLRVAGTGSELARRAVAIKRLSTAIETLGVVNEHQKFAASAMALCNELASRWGGDRVSLGILKGRYVKLRALSHTEKFSRKMELVQEIETVMEECLDQDVEVLVPPPPQSTFGSREAEKFAARHGPMCLVSLPLRSEGKVAGVLTLERPPGKPLAAEDVETLRLTCDLCTPRLMSLEQHDRWFGAKIASGLRSAAAGALGSSHTGVKLIVLGIVAFLLFAFLAKGDYQAEASFSVDTDQRRVVSAPFDAILESVSAEPGDSVKSGQVIANLRTADLLLELAKYQADRQQAIREAEAARGAIPPKTAEAGIAEARVEQAEAQVRLLTRRIEEANIVSPLDGIILQGDLRKVVGIQVRTGQALFEIAPADAFRAELLVPEDQIADVREGMTGTLATAGKPEEKAAFVIERIEPVAEVVGQKNVFRVRARLQQTYPWMRLGLEGVAKIDIDRRSYAWLWSRPAVNWLRMKLWM